MRRLSRPCHYLVVALSLWMCCRIPTRSYFIVLMSERRRTGACHVYYRRVYTISIPSPSALALLLSQSDSTMQTITKLHPDGTSSVEFDNPFDFYDESLLVSKTTFTSISDDGKIWKWLLSAEGIEDALKNASDLDMGTIVMYIERLFM